ncbi:MAG: twin-arginine translocation signal domain-containing protein, partial [Aquabacterium sp.]|nr:twin-arginine translocation signal domain-containing protein [Aquabacterium sp.]
MLLTRKSAGDGATSSSRTLVDNLARGLTRAVPTMDRRKFLRRSGLGLGAGIAASQLTLVRKAQAADAPAVGGAGAKIEV